MNHQDLPANNATGTPSAPAPVHRLPNREQGGDEAVPSSTGASTAMRQVVTLASNVAVITALLVYFGWRRTETQAARLGVDETIFGLSTRDYLLRSVGPVLQLLAIMAAAGLAAVYFDRALRRRVEDHGPKDRALRIALFAMSISWILLPLLIVGLGYIAMAVAFVAFPLAIAAGVLLLVYASHLRRDLRGDDPQPAGWGNLERTFVLVALCVTAFWATSNYAEILGDQIAETTISHVRDLTAVTVYAPQRLGISAPGIHETPISGVKQTYRYRYTGLRLLEHAGGRYFLIPDLWKPKSGMIIMLDDSPPLRFEFSADTAK